MQINKNDIHAQISTVEQLAVYVLNIMYSQFPGSFNVVDDAGGVVSFPHCQKRRFEDANGVSRYIFEVVIPLKSDLETKPRYDWMHADQIDKASPIVFPNSYKTANLTYVEA